MPTYRKSALKLRIILLIALLFFGLPVQAENVNVGSSSNLATLHVGDTFVVDVSGQGFAFAIIGDAFALSFDPGILKLDS